VRAQVADPERQRRQLGGKRLGPVAISKEDAGPLHAEVGDMDGRQRLRRRWWFAGRQCWLGQVRELEVTAGADRRVDHTAKGSDGPPGRDAGVASG
jgi:hypothetical protein